MKALERAKIKNFRFHDCDTAKMTMRYTRLSMDYERQAVSNLPAIGDDVIESKEIREAELQQDLENPAAAKVVRFRK